MKKIDGVIWANPLTNIKLEGDKLTIQVDDDILEYRVKKWLTDILTLEKVEGGINLMAGDRILLTTLAATEVSEEDLLYPALNPKPVSEPGKQKSIYICDPYAMDVLMEEYSKKSTYKKKGSTNGGK